MGNPYLPSGSPGAGSPTMPPKFDEELFGGLAVDASTACCGALDVRRLVERCLGSRQLVDRVLTSLAARFVEELDLLRGELVAGDLEAAAKAAHCLKGACGNASACELASLAERIEEAARAEQIDLARRFCDEMDAAWGRFLAARDELWGGSK